MIWNTEQVCSTRSSYETPVLRQARRLMALTTMQNTLAGTKPSCAVLTPMIQMSTLFTVANAQPSQQRRPTKTVDAMVNTQER